MFIYISGKQSCFSITIIGCDIYWYSDLTVLVATADICMTVLTNSCVSNVTALLMIFATYAAVTITIFQWHVYKQGTLSKQVLAQTISLVQAILSTMNYSIIYKFIYRSTLEFPCKWHWVRIVAFKISILEHYEGNRLSFTKNRKDLSRRIKEKMLICGNMFLWLLTLRLLN